MEFNFKVDPHKLTTGELLEAENDLARMNNLMSRFLVDLNGDPIPQEEAIVKLLGLSFADNYEAQQDFLAGLLRATRSGRR